MDKKQILNSYQFRHACKEFDANKKISQADLEYLYEVISLSPSSFGLQAFEVLSIEDRDLLTEMLPFVWGGQKQLPTGSQTFIFLTRNDVKLNDNYLKHIVVDIQDTPIEMQEFRFNLIHNHQLNEIKIQENPRVINDWLAKQAYIALGNVMTAAAQIGIDSCPIEGFVKSEITDILIKKGLFDKSIHEVAVMCSFGYRKSDPVRAKMRKPMSELVKVV